MSPPKFLDLDQTHTSLHKLSVMDETEKNELSKTDYSIFIGNMHIETQELAFSGLTETKKWPKKAHNNPIIPGLGNKVRQSYLCSLLPVGF